MFEVIEKGNTVFYINNKHNLKIKADKIDDLHYIYINLNGYNPIFSMLIGGFENECEMSGINFQVINSDGSNSLNSDYCIINIKDIKAFATEVYCFIIENNVVGKLRETDKSPWDF